ncbi:MAG TPA: branched-chain-amino-acid transaminase [Vicinamibacterales bacterium]|nr:branched-chain-amino-acid transaminase [Vicinamibacterales bacterium]
MNGLIYVDGDFLPESGAAVSVLDHGLLYGDGIFEGIRAYNGRVFRLERHIERLFDSAKAIRLEMPLPPQDIERVVVDACRQNRIQDGYIRLVVTRGAGDLTLSPRSCTKPSLIVIAREVAPLFGRAEREGIALATSAFRRNPPDALSPSIKSLNYLNNVLARIEAHDKGADEALLLDRDGYVAEGTADNIFIVTERALVSPPTPTNLRGITRETILRLAADLGVRTEERRFALFDLWTAREAFICGTFAEVAPVRSVDGRLIGSGEPGPTTRRLMAAYGELVRSTGTPIYHGMSVPAGVVAGSRV